MEEKIYEQKAPAKNNAVLRILMFGGLFLIFCVLLFIASVVPYSGIVTLGVLFLFALEIYKLMKGTVLDITYVLYEDKLVFVRRYGKIEMETEEFLLSEAEFKGNVIVYRGKNYAFYPDEKLKSLLEG